VGGFSPRAEKPVRFRIPAGIRAIIACCGVRALADPKRDQLRQPADRQPSKPPNQSHSSKLLVLDRERFYLFAEKRVKPPDG
jgi:hypothetical protein